jgi:hypothetical protein
MRGEEHAEWCGQGPLAPSRFRPNIVLRGLPPWTEFDWVGSYVRIGSVTLHVLARTVRCEATNVDARAGSGRSVVDVPALLKLHFPAHGPYLGVYARVVEGGSLRVGDTVTVVLPSSTSSLSSAPSLSSDVLPARSACEYSMVAPLVSPVQRRLWIMVFLVGTVSVALFAIWANGLGIDIDGSSSSNNNRNSRMQ